ncbi:MAG TPA: tetratricopeptide repeat protein, partial [Urbifossiella sp.]|nr:tetratricopeptide repeat protein [Urbifossiella sp.]
MGDETDYQRAVRRHRAGDLAAAEADYLRILAADPNHSDAWANLGAVQSAQGRNTEAIDCYRRALEARPGHPAATFNLGVVLLRVGRPAEALDR